MKIVIIKLRPTVAPTDFVLKDAQNLNLGAPMRRFLQKPGVKI